MKYSKSINSPPSPAVVEQRVVTDDGMSDEEREALHASIVSGNRAEKSAERSAANQRKWAATPRCLHVLQDRGLG